MRIDDLLGLGFSPRVIECWKSDGLRTLLPLQVEAVKGYGILDGRNLLISGPTSSGKTFCGELASLRSVRDNRKAVFLVPLKALAAEKFAEFKKRYRKIGLKIIIVSSDYPEYKKPFVRGEFDIAVVVYEMFNALTVTGLAALESVGTVVFDEFQLIAAVDRGIAYEAAIAKIKNSGRKIQIIGLIGGLRKCDLFKNWLNIPLLNSDNRPVELYQGVLFNGKFNYKRYNDYSEGNEYLVSNDDTDEINFNEFGGAAELFKAVKYLTDKNEQALVFVSTRNGCQDLAEQLAQILDLPAAEYVLARLDDIPDTLQKVRLVECLKNGIGFHNADLSPTYRKLLEDGFGSGEIRVMVCTSTLALGVNLPSKNVFIEPAKYYDGFNGEPALKPLLLDDYNQIAGRAGRYGKEENFGRAIIIANDENDRERIREYYIDGSAGPIVQLFDTEKLAGLALRWISCGLIKDYNDARDLLKTSLRGYCEGFDISAPTRVIDYLNLHGFITLKGCRLVCTDLGKAAAGHNIELDTAARIRDGYVKFELNGNFLSWLYYLTEFPECRSALIRHNSSHYFHEPIREFIEESLKRYDETAREPLRDLLEDSESSATPSRVKTFKFLADIIEPIPTIELEENNQCGWGRLKRTGEFFSNIFGAVTDFGKGGELTKKQQDEFAVKAHRLYHGLPESGLLLAQLRVPLLERDYILRLNRADIFTPADIVSAGFDVAGTLIPDFIARALYDKCRAIVARLAKADTIEKAADKPPITARKVGIRYEVKIGEATINLQQRLYVYLNKLYNADHPQGWLDKGCLDTGSNQVKYMYKLRKALAPVDSVSVESDGAGRYRLVLKGIERPAQGVEVAR